MRFGDVFELLGERERVGVAVAIVVRHHDDGVAVVVHPDFELVDDEEFAGVARDVGRQPLVECRSRMSGSNWLKWVGPSIGAPASWSLAASSASWMLPWPSANCSASIWAGDRNGPVRVISVSKRTPRTYETVDS